MRTYLIIDDEPLIRKGTIKKIERGNLPVACSHEANNGREALEYLEENEVDFIITDMDMPEIDGVEFLKIVDQRYAHLPVIVISGYQNFSYIQQAMKSQAINYILKPFSREDISEAIKQVLALYEKREKSQETENELLFGVISGNPSKRGEELLSAYIEKEKETFLVLTFQKVANLAEITWLKEHSLLAIDHPFVPGIHFFLLSKAQLQQLRESSLQHTYFSARPIRQEGTALEKIYEELILQMNHLTKQLPPGEVISGDTTLDNGSMDNLKYFLFLIESGSSLQLRKDLQLFFETFAEEHNLLDFKQVGFNLISETKKMLNQYYQANSNYTLPDIQKKVLSEIFTFEEATLYFIKFLVNISESMKYEEIYSSQDLITNVQKYIQLHFAENLNLNFLSEIFYVNSSYLSNLFKEKTGKKYVDFLNELRIEKAKSLLLTSKRPIKQIAHQVGYENEKYFYRVFKKFTQLSPEQFRNTPQENG